MPVTQTINHNDILAISKMVNEIAAHKAELEAALPPEKMKELDDALETIAVQPEGEIKELSKFKKATSSVWTILKETGSLASNWLTTFSTLKSLSGIP